MNLTLGKVLTDKIEEKVRRGMYQSAEDVVMAGLLALEQQEMFGDFAPGELDRLIAEGEASIKSGKTLPADEVYAQLRARYRSDADKTS